MYIAFEQLIKIMINVLIQILTRNKQGKGYYKQNLQ